MKDTDLAWLAGIVDGEGHLCLRRWHNKITAFPRSVIFRIVICNTDAAIINKCQEIYKELGTYGYINFQKVSFRHKAIYKLIVPSAKRAKAILVAIEPYLVAKRALAQMMIRYTDSRNGKKNARLTQEEEAMVSATTAATRRGPPGYIGVR